MQTTRTGAMAEFLGADLTDATATRPRPIDVCGLRIASGALVPAFWEWRWAGEGIEAIVEELRAARCSMLDGPQALAAPGRSLRACERLTRAAGKTPDTREALVPGRPFAGFVRTSLDLFAALDGEGLPISPPGFVGGVGEVYPGHLWARLAPGLESKTSAVGARRRRAILGACGLSLPDEPLGHDRLDAALAALVAAAAAGAAPGLSVEALGDPLARRPDGTLEEGPIAVLAVERALRDTLREAAAAASEPRTRGRRTTSADRAASSAPRRGGTSGRSS